MSYININFEDIDFEDLFIKYLMATYDIPRDEAESIKTQLDDYAEEARTLAQTERDGKEK